MDLALRIALVLPTSVSLATGAAGAQVGTAARHTVIGEANLPGQLEHDAYFGWSLAALGDVDGDGIGDLAVGAPGESWPPSNENSVWILFLRPDGSVRAAQQLSHGVGGFSDPVVDGTLGTAIAGPGDVDGDGIPDLVTSISTDDPILRRGAIAVLFLKRDGTVRKQQRISQTEGNFGGILPTGAQFGLAIAPLGDRDGDGIQELAVGAGRGAGVIWILHLDNNGLVRTERRLGAGEPALAGLLANGDNFGGALVPLGDLDGDGDVDLAVGGPKGMIDGKVWILRLAPDASVEAASLIGRTEVLPDFAYPYYPSALAAVPDIDGDGRAELVISAYDYRTRGAVAVVSLAADGSVRRSALMAHRTGGIGILTEIDFGYSVAGLGDLDHDGLVELAVGAPYAGDDVGEVWMLELDGNAVRTGTGRNSAVLSTASEPVLGQPWSLDLDCGGHAPGLAVVTARGAPFSGLFTAAGEVLIDPASPRYFTFRAPHSGAGAHFSTAVPNDIALANLVLHVQGTCTGSPGPRLSNALDLIVGR